ncbi:MAG: hypothetical protein C4289_01310 [Chloroflexota bacterium]
MSCPDTGAWRAWLDDEAGTCLADPAEHLQTCAACRYLVEELRQNAGGVAVALAALSPGELLSPADVARAHGWSSGARRRPSLRRLRPHGRSSRSAGHVSSVSSPYSLGEEIV